MWLGCGCDVVGVWLRCGWGVVGGVGPYTTPYRAQVFNDDISELYSILMKIRFDMFFSILFIYVSSHRLD